MPTSISRLPRYRSTSPSRVWGCSHSSRVTPLASVAMPLVFLQSIVVALGVSHEISTLTTPHTGTCRNHHSASTTFHLCCFAFRSSEAALRQAAAKETFAQTQATRYEQLLSVRGTSEETVVTKRQELAVASAALVASREDIARLRAELEALRAQRGNLRLVAPVAGLVAARDADPGTTVVAGQAVIEVIDTAGLWVDTRIDQISAEGLAIGLPAKIVLRSP